MKDEIKAPDALKSQERELEDAINYMISLMSRMYKNQVLLALSQGTINKFSDAQTGNYATILTALSNRLSRKMRSRFSNKRIKQVSDRILSKNDRRSKELFYNRVAKSIAIDPAKLLKKDGTSITFNALVLENTEWIKKLRDETLEMYTANSLRSMATGESIDSILSQFDDMVEKRKNHSKMVARTQINTFNSLMNKTRAQKLGIKKAIWVASNDERTRPSHEDRDGKEYDLAKGCYSSKDGKWLQVGVDYQCRCSARFLLDDEDEA